MPSATSSWKALAGGHSKRPSSVHSSRGPGAGRLHGVGEEHDRGLQALGPVHGHHADGVAGFLLRVALDHHGAGFQPVQEALEGGHVGALEGQGQVEKLRNGVEGVGAEAADQLVPAPPRPEEVRIELKRRQDAGHIQVAGEFAPGGGEGGVVPGPVIQFPPQGAAAAVGEGEQAFLVEADERSLEHGRPGSGRRRAGAGNGPRPPGP